MNALLANSMFAEASDLQALAAKVEQSIKEHSKSIYKPPAPQLNALPAALKIQLTGIINDGLEQGAIDPFPILYKMPVEPELLAKEWQSALI